jgi:hypothetical protein
LVVITEMPVVSPRQELRDGLDRRAYFATVAPGEIGATLGVLERAPGLSQLDYVQSLAALPTEIDLSQFTSRPSRCALNSSRTLPHAFQAGESVIGVKLFSSGQGPLAVILPIV